MIAGIKHCPSEPKQRTTTILRMNKHISISSVTEVLCVVIRDHRHFNFETLQKFDYRSEITPRNNSVHVGYKRMENCKEKLSDSNELRTHVHPRSMLWISKRLGGLTNFAY